ncbi:hypothetical protein MasN3_36080 [Massilia varians]|uniref:Uncharacterized protein n=1 Tax=Massilia varians TaxID=457921 RepID=A0ABN6TD22_9BURK|nr:hypothetical protein [Massilia varians]BDT60114.1 hypothetical protein MasN3_36080 [Massilia varians]
MYVPGKPHPFFPRHQFHGVRVYGNYQRVEECRTHHYVGSCATVKHGIAAYVLSPEHLWATFQTEAEDLLKVNGSFIADPTKRNRRINAAYARLWLADKRFQWAGLAAFASKQVGCGLLHSTDVIERNRREREQIQRSFAQAAVSGAEAATLVQMGTEVAAHNMLRRLGHGNMHLFLDIYPLHRFFMERGWEDFEKYLRYRQNDKYPVYWDIDRARLPFGVPFREITLGFERIHAGTLHEGVRLLAQHEQLNILQKIMYDDRFMQSLLAINQFAWATGFPTGDYQEIQLTLSAQCKGKTGVTSWFSKEKYAKLWVPEQRMPFVFSAAERFDKLLNSPERRRFEESIQAVAEGGDIR